MRNSNIQKHKIEDRKALKSYFFKQPKLKEIFNSLDNSQRMEFPLSRIHEILHLLNIQHSGNFEELSFDLRPWLSKPNITFEDFLDFCSHLYDFVEAQKYPKGRLVFDFQDPSLFILASDTKVIKKDFSARILDESVIIRKRIDMKYSVTANVDQNIKILKNIENEVLKNYETSPYKEAFLKYSYSLRDCWVWIGKCIENRRTSHDLTQGLREVLNTLYESKVNVNNHVEKIVMTQYIVYSNHERHEVFNLLGWSYVDPSSKQFNHPKLYGIVDQEENYSRAAALCVFHFDFAQAFQCLNNVQNPNEEVVFMKSILQLLKDWQYNIQQDRDMRFVLNVDSGRFHDECDEKNYVAQDFSQEIFPHKTKPPKYDSLIKELKLIQSLCEHLNPVDPYFRAICRFIANNEAPSRIIKDHNLSFLDRIAFAYRFLGPKSLQVFLNEVIDEAKEDGLLAALLLVGKNPEGFQIVQKYLDNTGDIQSVALLGAYFKAFKFPQEDFFESLLTDYKDLLNRLGRWEERIYLEKKILDLDKMLSDPGKDKNQAQEHASFGAGQKCYVCKKPLSKPTLLTRVEENRKKFAQMHKQSNTELNFCSDCVEPLPNCGICLLPVSVLNPYIELQEKIKRVTSKKENTAIDPEETLIWCQKCKHGGHFGHVDDWFQNHTKCPVSGCLCECIQNDYH